MSKNFENEYNKMLDDQIPDLWSRIEPQLHEKVVVQKVAKKRNIKKYIPLFSLVAVACVASAIIIPGLVNSQLFSKSDMTASSHMSSNSAGTVADSASDSMADVSYADAAEEVADVSYADAAEEVADYSADSSSGLDFTGNYDSAEISESDSKDEYMTVVLDDIRLNVPEYLYEASSQLYYEKAQAGDGSELGQAKENEVNIEEFENVNYYTYIYVAGDSIYKLYFSSEHFDEDEFAEIISSITVN